MCVGWLESKVEQMALGNLKASMEEEDSDQSSKQQVGRREWGEIQGGMAFLLLLRMSRSLKPKGHFGEGTSGPALDHGQYGTQ